jgi:hypothetical protein
MSIIFCLLLIVLGLLAAQDFLGQKAPIFKKCSDALNPYSDYIGLAGLVVGVLWVLEVITTIFTLLHILFSHPFFALMPIILSLLMLSLGLILGLNYALKLIGNPQNAFIAKVTQIRDSLTAHKKNLGLAGVGLGLLFLLIIVAL